MEEERGGKKMKILCLHGFRTSGAFLKKQISKWDPSIFASFDMVFPDGIFPAGGKSEIEGIFPPPYFEWFQFNEEFTEYTNLEKCISHLCEYMVNNGPFDGLLGFSQGATLSALLLGYQTQGVLLKDHPPLKLFVSISGSKFRDPKITQVANKDSIKTKSVHFIGAKDWLRLPSEDLATAFENPLIIRHPQGHTVPRLDDAAIEQLKVWTTGILETQIVDGVHSSQNGGTHDVDGDHGFENGTCIVDGEQDSNNGSHIVHCEHDSENGTSIHVSKNGKIGNVAVMGGEVAESEGAAEIPPLKTKGEIKQEC